MHKAIIYSHLRLMYKSENAVMEQLQPFDRLVERECCKEIIKCDIKHGKWRINDGVRARNNIFLSFLKMNIEHIFQGRVSGISQTNS